MRSLERYLVIVVPERLALGCPLLSPIAVGGFFLVEARNWVRTLCLLN